MVMRIIFNDKNNNILLNKDYSGSILVYVKKDYLVVCKNNYFVEKIFFSDYKDFDSYSIYNYD